MNKRKRTFFLAELFLLLLALLFAWKIFNQNEPEKRVAVVLSESGDKRWDSLIKGMKQAAKVKGIHLIICNTDEIENAESEKEVIVEQQNNDADAFIVWPAPGKDTKKMLKKENNDVPLILIGEDLYEDQEGTKSGFAVVGPDGYKIGEMFGKMLGDKNRKIGIVAGWKESQTSTEEIRGFMDIVNQSESQVKWCCYREKEEDICTRVSGMESVDTIVVLDPGALDKLGEQAEDGLYCGAEIYGIGSSAKAIALQDYGRIKGLIIPDGYEIGYKSVEEISKKLEHRHYKMKSSETGEKIFAGKQFLNNDVERFLYSYE